MTRDAQASIATTPRRRRRNPAATTLDRWLSRRRTAIRALAVATVGGLGFLWMQGSGPVRPLLWHQQHVRIETVTDSLDLRVRRADGSGGRVAVGLLGISAIQDHTDRGRQWLLSTCGPEALWLEVHTASSADGTERVMAYVYLPDGRMLNEELLRLGLAQAPATAQHPLRPWFHRLQVRSPTNDSRADSVAKRP